jgi:hypothetical protein
MSTSNADWNATIVNKRLDEAANEIERLRVDVEVLDDRRIKARVYANNLEQENERLREALGTIVATKSVADINPNADAKMMWIGCVHIAKAALKEGE